MEQQEMIKEKLLDKDYYLSKISMFMKECYGISPQIDILLDWMKSIKSGSDYLLNILNIWDSKYKEEMREKFGERYYTRKKTEVPVKLRGSFEMNDIDPIIKLSNVDVTIKIDGEEKLFDYIVFPDPENTSKILALNLITEDDAQLENDAYYVEVPSENSNLFSLDKATPLNANKGNPLYVFDDTTHSYIITKDEYFKQATDYFSNQKGVEATPKNLGLYENKAYIFEYFETPNSYSNKKGPKDLKFYENLYKTTSDIVFDPENEGKNYYKFAKLNAYNSNVVKVSPIYLRLYEWKNEEHTEYQLSQDPTFIYQKAYFSRVNNNYIQVTPQTADGGEALQELNESNTHAYSRDEYIDFSKKYYIKGDDVTYQLVNYYNYFFNLYYLTKNYKTAETASTKSGFDENKNYYLEGIIDETPVKPTDLELYDINGELIEDEEFIQNKYYYIKTNREGFASPLTLNLYEEIFENETATGNYQKSYDLKFLEDKNYYSLKIASPDQSVYNGAPLYFEEGGEYVQVTETSFVENKIYYYKISGAKDYFYQATPYNLNLKTLQEEKKLSEYNPKIEGDFIADSFYTNEQVKYKEYTDNNYDETDYTEIFKYTSTFEYNIDDTWTEEDPDAEDFAFLDVLANLVGCSRKNIIKKVETSVDPSTGETTYDIKYDKLPDLSNEDLLDLIKIRIIQNNYRGTMQELINLYKEKLHYELYICLDKINNLEEASYNSASCTVYLLDFKPNDNNEMISERMRELFLYSDLFIQSMGIAYNKALISSLDTLLMLDKDYNSKGEKAVYSLAEGEEILNESSTSTKLG